MHLFVFDYQGTLTTLLDPINFIASLRRRFPSARVVIHSGSEVPGDLLAVVDDFWEKPYPISTLIDEPFTEVTIVDDQHLIRCVMSQALRTFPDGTWRVLDEGALPGLLQG
jgi:DNA-binding NarL/FixJ family response regulator